MRIASLIAAFLLLTFGSALSGEAAQRPFSVSWSVVDAQVRGDYWDVLFSSPMNGVPCWPDWCNRKNNRWRSDLAPLGKWRC